MNKLSLCLAVAATMALPFAAQAANQQNRMKECASQYNADKAAGKIDKSQHKDYMSKCLKKDGQAGMAGMSGMSGMAGQKGMAGMSGMSGMSSEKK